MKKICINKLKELLDYNPETGIFTWKVREDDPQWSGHYAGKIAGSKVKKYIRVAIDDTAYAAHRLAWAIHYGVWPVSILDHINGDGFDNRIENLREASFAQNAANAHRTKLPASGYRGVYRYKKTDKWKAEISYENERHYLGVFDTKEEAHQAYLRASAEIHGEYSAVFKPDPE